MARNRIEYTCRDCGEPWLATVYPATWGYSGGEPACVDQTECPKCGGHDVDCDCDECKPPSKGVILEGLEEWE